MGEGRLVLQVRYKGAIRGDKGRRGFSTVASFVSSSFCLGREEIGGRSRRGDQVWRGLRKRVLSGVRPCCWLPSRVFKRQEELVGNRKLALHTKTILTKALRNICVVATVTK